MGDKQSFPGLPREEGDAQDFRERAVIAAAATESSVADGDLASCLQELDARTFDPGSSAAKLAKQIVENLIDDLGPSGFDKVAVGLVEAFSTAVFRQVAANPP